jgi:hypothetical protein
MGEKLIYFAIWMTGKHKRKKLSVLHEERGEKKHGGFTVVPYGRRPTEDDDGLAITPSH